jgi:hypothetical protein
VFSVFEMLLPGSIAAGAGGPYPVRGHERALQGHRVEMAQLAGYQESEGVVIKRAGFGLELFRDL